MPLDRKQSNSGRTKTYRRLDYQQERSSSFEVCRPGFFLESPNGITLCLHAAQKEERYSAGSLFFVGSPNEVRPGI